MVDINRGTENDSEDEEEYCLLDENLEDNVDNASSDNEIIVYPLPEQSITSGAPDVIVIERQ